MKVELMTRFLLTNPGPRPPCYKVAEHLWGADCTFDSDGNSDTRDATDWTELTVTRRLPSGENDDQQRVDVDPVDGTVPLILAIRSDNDDLARRAARFLEEHAGGALAHG